MGNIGVANWHSESDIYFATADERGSYQISGLPAGRYKVRAWHESLPPIETWANLDDATLRAIDLKFKP